MESQKNNKTILKEKPTIQEINKSEMPENKIDLSNKNTDKVETKEINIGDKVELGKIANKEVKLSSSGESIDTNNKPKEIKNSSISTYNGSSCDLYNWSQGTTDVQIQIKLPENTGAKKVRIVFLIFF